MKPWSLYDRDLKFFRKALGRVKPFTREEERKSIAQAQKGDIRARNELVRRNMPLVISVARKFAHKNNVSIEDLIQEGVFGLMRATTKFNLRRPVRFYTYAAHWVHAHVSRYAQRTKGSVSVHSGFRKFDAPLDVPAGPNGETFGEILVDLSDGPEAEFERGEIATEVNEALSRVKGRLGPLGADIVERRLMRGADATTLQDVGDRWGISRERVRQVEAKTKAFLADYFAREIPGVET